MNATNNSHAILSLLDAFRARYFRLECVIEEAMRSPTDSTVLERIGDDLMEYSSLLNDVRQYCFQIGRPQIIFDPQFLAWAYNRRSISALARFLGVGRTTLRNALIEHGILPQQQQPLNHSHPNPLSLHSYQQSHGHLQESESIPGAESDDILEPNLNIPETLPEDVRNISRPIPIASNRLSEISDEDLDDLIIRLRLHYRRAGIGMIDGMLTRLGHRVQRERIRMSLLRIDPVRRVFERIRIRRRTYRVAGPNALWHHDGQHAYCLCFRSVHNVRIERLWVDVTAQVGATWANLFTTLELRHGLDINNPNHIWLLQFLFLPTINQDLTFFAEAWNEHLIQIRDGPNRSPIDMFNFDMLVHGVRGSDLTEVMSAEELEVYGIDWEGLRDDRILHSQQLNNDIEEGETSWLGHRGPPERLNEVLVDSPDMPFDENICQGLLERLRPWLGRADDESVILGWTHGLAYAYEIDMEF
ncbi:hypothetical protein BJ912DRAFT_863836 [Pholiota molesta]|nr:hypothetical protein BJ912DRAFT_863836 [Pholiota molesta]